MKNSNTKTNTKDMEKPNTKSSTIKAALARYSNAFGVSGNEGKIFEMLKKDLTDYVDTIEKDTMGNLIAVRKGTQDGPKIMLAAHMDEIGLMVKHVDENGFLKFVKIGGWFDQTLLNQRVVVHGSVGDIYGVVGSKPPHVMTPEDSKSPVKHKDMFIDIGATSQEEALKLGIRPGVYISLDRDFKELANNRVTSKSFDNRAGVVIMLEAVKRLSGKKLKSTVYAVGTVQEEVGLKGAKTSAYSCNADAAIAIDTTIPGDHPGITKNDSSLEIGKGPVVTVVDASGRGLIAHPTVLKWLEESAQKSKIPIQYGVGEGGTTDATAIHLTNSGIPTGTISIATRYIHSPVEVLDINDMESGIQLVVSAIETADKYF